MRVFCSFLGVSCRGIQLIWGFSLLLFCWSWEVSAEARRLKTTSSEEEEKAIKETARLSWTDGQPAGFWSNKSIFRITLWGKIWFPVLKKWKTFILFPDCGGVSGSVSSSWFTPQKPIILIKWPDSADCSFKIQKKMQIKKKIFNLFALAKN